jgi:teichuronic acid biosynthesis glycosyltransferase TuaG
MNLLPKVSIIIPTYNCQYVDQAIESALSQTYPNTEVVVVNDGSTLFNEKIHPYYGRIRYIEQRNGGTASALNVGIQSASGDYFAWLSADDLYVPHKVHDQIAFMQRMNAVVSYTNYHVINEHNKIIGESVIRSPLKDIQFYHSLIRGNPVNGCTVMMKMSVFSQIGFFNEALRYTQDYEMWVRVVQQHKFHYLNNPLVLYRVHAGMGSQNYGSAMAKECELVRRIYSKSLINLITKQVNL